MTYVIWDPPLPTVYRYRWGNNETRAKLKGRACTIVAVGGKGSALLEFSDTGERVVSSRRALRRETFEEELIRHLMAPL